MKKKIIALVLSFTLILSLMIPTFAQGKLTQLAEELSGEESTTSGGFSFDDIDIGDILNSDIMQDIMANENVIDITNLVITLMATYNLENLKAMGQEEAEKLIANIVDFLAGSITQITGNADLIIKYDPLEVIGNLFDADTEKLTTQKQTTTHPDELELGMGDADGDGKITAADARLILRRAAKLVVFTPEQEARADVDGDGKITAKDARMVLRVAAKLDPVESLGK